MKQEESPAAQSGQTTGFEQDDQHHGRAVEVGGEDDRGKA